VQVHSHVFPSRQQSNIIKNAEDREKCPRLAGEDRTTLRVSAHHVAFGAKPFLDAGEFMARLANTYNTVG
jgi:hypothetical protein